jgi:hypothetical protein
LLHEAQAPVSAATPGARALRSAERATAATHALRRVYGEGVDGWQLCHGRVGNDTLLAACIDPGLHEQLVKALASADVVLDSLRPSFVVAFNACLRWLDRPSWLVVVEPGRAVVCFCDGKQLRSLRSHRLQRELQLELPGWLQQQRLVGGYAEPDTGVVASQFGVAATLVDLDALGAAAPAPS